MSSVCLSAPPAAPRPEWLPIKSPYSYSGSEDRRSPSPRLRVRGTTRLSTACNHYCNCKSEKRKMRMVRDLSRHY